MKQNNKLMSKLSFVLVFTMIVNLFLPIISQAQNNEENATKTVKAILPLDENNNLILYTSNKNISKVQVVFDDNTTDIFNDNSYVYEPKNKSDIQAIVNNIKGDFDSVVYEDFYALLKPYISQTEKQKVKTSYKQKNGVFPTDEQLENILKSNYLDFLDMRRSFNNVKMNLEENLSALIEKSSTIDESFIRNNKVQIMLGLTVLERQYNFRIGNFSVKDFIIYYPNVFGSDLSAIDTVVQIGNVNSSEIALDKNIMLYKNRLSNITKNNDIVSLIENLLDTFDTRELPQWILDTSKAYIYESTTSSIKDSSFVSKIRNDEKSKKYLIPILTLSEKNIYVLSTSKTTLFGLVDSYIDNSNYEVSKNEFEENLLKTVQNQEKFLEFWYRLTDKKEEFENHQDVIAVDSMKRYSNDKVDVRTLWMEKYGENTSSGIREFITPLNLYADYIQADGQASGKEKVTFYIAQALTDRGQAVYTHELTHIFDKDIWFDANGRRDGKGPEVFARGLFESINNSPSVSSYVPVFNLNTAYVLGDDRVQNASPERFESDDDIKKYMQSAMDIIYTLDYAEAKVIFEKSNEDKALLFNKIEFVPDDSNPNLTNDNFRNITIQEASELNTISNLVDNNIVSSRLVFQGLQTIGKTRQNDYLVIPMFEPVYAALQNNNGAVGDFAFKRNAYDLLSEYGYKKGMMPYISGKYANDALALEGILDSKYNGSFANFKKDMFARRIEKLDNLKPTSIFNNFDELLVKMRDAVNKDLMLLKSSGTSIAKVENVRNLKRSIYQEYLRTSNDFSNSIYEEEQQQRIIYVSDGPENSTLGAGTQENPYDNIKYAISKAKDGDIIRLVKNILYREQAGETSFLINKSVTIDGQGFILGFRTSELNITKDVKFENLTLNINASAGQYAKIYANGNEVTFDRVSTKIGQNILQDAQRPIIVAGSKQGEPVGTNAKINILGGSSENRFKKIIAGNSSNDSTLPVTITINSEFAKIDEGIILGGDGNFKTKEKVTVISNSKNVKTIDATNSEKNEVILKESRINSLNLINIENLTLTDRAKLTTNNLRTIANTLRLDENTELTLNSSDKTTVKIVTGNGNIILSSNSSLEITQDIDANLPIKVQMFPMYMEQNLNKEYVYVPENTTANVTLFTQNDPYKIIKDSNVYKLSKENEQPLIYDVKLIFKHNSATVLEKDIQVNNGDDIENIENDIPTAETPYYYEIALTFDRNILNNISENKEIEIPLVKKVSMVTIKPFDKTNIQNMEIVSLPNKVNYTESETMDLTGIKLKLTDKNNMSITISERELQEYGITLSDNATTALKIADTRVTITKSNIQKYFDITVTPLAKNIKIDPIVEKTITEYFDTESNEDIKNKLFEKIQIPNNEIVNKEIIGNIPKQPTDLQIIEVKVIYDDNTFDIVNLKVKILKGNRDFLNEKEELLKVLENKTNTKLQEIQNSNLTVEEKDAKKQEILLNQNKIKNAINNATEKLELNPIKDDISKIDSFVVGDSSNKINSIKQIEDTSEKKIQEIQNNNSAKQVDKLNLINKINEIKTKEIQKVKNAKTNLELQTITKNAISEINKQQLQAPSNPVVPSISGGGGSYTSPPTQNQTATQILENLNKISTKKVKFQININEYEVLENEKIEISKKIQSAPYIKNARIMLPLRAIGDVFGFKTSWDNNTKTATLEKEGRKILVKNGEYKISINGKEQKIDAPSEITNSSIMLELKSIATAIEQQISWDNKTKIVTIILK